jgi:hypothetical protein
MADKANKLESVATNNAAPGVVVASETAGPAANNTTPAAGNPAPVRATTTDAAAVTAASPKVPAPTQQLPSNAVAATASPAPQHVTTPAIINPRETHKGVKAREVAGPNDSIQPVAINRRAAALPRTPIDPAASRVNATIPTSPAPTGGPAGDTAPDQDAVGAVVRYVLPTGSPFAGEVRPALVTRGLSDGTFNLTLFLGEQQDLAASNVQALTNGGIVAMLSGVRHSDGNEPGTFHRA